MCVHSMWLLTLYWQGDGLAGLVLSVLVIYRLDVVAPGIWCHSGQDDQRVVQSDGTEEGTTRQVERLKKKKVFSDILYIEDKGEEK